jgi:hypothetical protein
VLRNTFIYVKGSTNEKQDIETKGGEGKEWEALVGEENIPKESSLQ